MNETPNHALQATATGISFVAGRWVMGPLRHAGCLRTHRAVAGVERVPTSTARYLCLSLSRYASRWLDRGGQVKHG